MLFRSKKPAFSIAIAQGALESIFDECDRYDADETGGRLLGTCRERDGCTEIEVKAVLEPGPNAQRSPTYFLQDGEHQERLFRAIEASHPDIEHLGNWHTHHVNGLNTLSSGDKTTYFKTVNHENHNTDFFYALLVVRKNRAGNPRYAIKHFIFRRNDQTIYEIPPDTVRVVNVPVLRPHVAESIETRDPAPPVRTSAPNPQRAKDQEFFCDFYPGLKSLVSKNTGALYWKGQLALVDGAHVEIVTMEGTDGEMPSYSIATSSKNPLFAAVLARCQERQFGSARHAVLHLERGLNEALYRAKKERGV
jgi:hypothetical protein